MNAANSDLWYALPVLTGKLVPVRAHVGPTSAHARRAAGIRFPYAQIDAVTGKFAGTTSFYDVVPALRTLAIGHTWLGRRWWRTGHNTEAKLLLMTHAFESLGAARVVWHTDIRNERSQAAIARPADRTPLAPLQGTLRRVALQRGQGRCRTGEADWTT